MKTEKYELYHQSNIIQIGNLIDDMHSVHVHLILLQRRYYRIYRKYAALSRKQYLSSGWFRAKRHLSRVHKKIANRRRDWFFKLALRLVRKYDKIAIETLNLEGMKKLWGRKVSDIAFSEFSLILQWTCAKYGKVFAKSGQWQPTTKACHACKHKSETLTLSDRYWTCPNCSASHDRDINAAINILQAGVAV